MRHLLLIVPLAAGALALGCGDDEPSEVVYLALGDSVAAGSGASDPGSTAYVPRFGRYLGEVEDGAVVTVVNLARGGETSSSMIDEGQIQEAVDELRAQDGVRVVTVHIGGNDGAALFEICGGGLTPECEAAIPSTLQTFAENFDTILGQLRDAAGPDTTIIAGSYYNALAHPACPLHQFAELGQVVLEGEPTLLPNGLNDIIRATAARHDVRVAEVPPLDPAQLQPDCLHATDDGYEAITEAFISAYEAA